MGKQENKEQTNQAVEIEGLNIEDAVQQEVKGRPRMGDRRYSRKMIKP
jgi:hypothetical protein